MRLGLLSDNLSAFLEVTQSNNELESVLKLSFCLMQLVVACF